MVGGRRILFQKQRICDTVNIVEEYVYMGGMLISFHSHWLIYKTMWKRRKEKSNWCPSRVVASPLIFVDESRPAATGPVAGSPRGCVNHDHQLACLRPSNYNHHVSACIGLGIMRTTSRRISRTTLQPAPWRRGRSQDAASVGGRGTCPSQRRMRRYILI